MLRLLLWRKPYDDTQDIKGTRREKTEPAHSSLPLSCYLLVVTTPLRSSYVPNGKREASISSHHAPPRIPPSS